MNTKNKKPTLKQLEQLLDEAAQFALRENIPIRLINSELNRKHGCCLFGLHGLQYPEKFGVVEIDEQGRCFNLENEIITAFDVAEQLFLTENQMEEVMYAFDSFYYPVNDSYSKIGRKLRKRYGKFIT